MVDPLQISVLVKAIDFLFNEGHKILQERRERRLKDNVAPMSTALPQGENILAENEILRQSDLTIKQKLLSKKINLNIWNAKEEYVEHLMKLIEINTKKYYLAKEQHTKWGDALVPSIIVHNLDEAENEIRENAEKLKEALGEVYEEKIDLKFLKN